MENSAITHRVSHTPLANDVVLQVSNLSTHFEFKRRTIKAVRDVSFTLKKGKTLAIVGESGSGKSVTSLSLMGLLAPPGRIAGGSALYRKTDGTVVDLTQLNADDLRATRGAEISMIFQEPMTSLNPLFTVGDQISEMLMLHESITTAGARQRTLQMLDMVEIPGAKQRIDEYPHQMSGGMRQRIMIALALVCNPSLLIADEPTTALDVTIQAQILDLLRRLQAEMSMSIMFITHNMGVVAEIADDVAVMYAGEVIEQGDVHQIFADPAHPYTRGLLASIPDPSASRLAEGGRARLFSIPGNVPPPHDMPAGCTFAPRCGLAEKRCSVPIELSDVTPNHLARCWKSGDPR